MTPAGRYLWGSFLRSGPRWRSHRWCWRSRPRRWTQAWGSPPPPPCWARPCSSCWEPAAGLPGLSSAGSPMLLQFPVKETRVKYDKTLDPVGIWFVHTSGVRDDLTQAMMQKMKNVLKGILVIKSQRIWSLSIKLLVQQGRVEDYQLPSKSFQQVTFGKPYYHKHTCRVVDCWSYVPTLRVPIKRIMTQRAD